MNKVNLVEPPSYWYAVQAAHENECNVCLEENKKLISLSPCFHKFCLICITKWINQPTSPGSEKTNDDCPNCRTKIAIHRSSGSNRQWVPIESTTPLVPIPGGNRIRIDRVILRHLLSRPRIAPPEYLFYAGAHVVHYLMLKK